MKIHANSKQFDGFFEKISFLISSVLNLSPKYPRNKLKLLIFHQNIDCFQPIDYSENKFFLDEEITVYQHSTVDFKI